MLRSIGSRGAGTVSGGQECWRAGGHLARTPQRGPHAAIKALELIPEDAVNDRAVTHNQLGMVYQHAGDIDRALPHYREAIRDEELQGDTYGAAQTRCNVALSPGRIRPLRGRPGICPRRPQWLRLVRCRRGERCSKDAQLIERLDKEIARRRNSSNWTKGRPQLGYWAIVNGARTADSEPRDDTAMDRNEFTAAIAADPEMAR